MASGRFSSLAIAVMLIGILFIIISIVAVLGAIYMYKYMSIGYGMGMMHGASIYVFAIPIIFMIVGIAIVAFSLLAMNRPSQGYSMGPPSEPRSNEVLKLLPEQERRMMEYIIKAGGEVFQYQAARDLSLSKVQSWRIVRRLEEKGLVTVVKVKGRNVIKLREH